MPTLLQDFCTYCSCYEIPRNYALWSGLGLLGATINRRVYIRHGDLVFHSHLFCCLVGKQGNGKTTAKDFAEKLFRKTSPEIPIGPSQQSREDIVKFMASDECRNIYRNEKGEDTELRAYHFFINELKNFVSYNPAGMVSFLTDIYDRDTFDASTIKRGLELIPNPCLNILACENPDWIIDNFKHSVISGGFGRRMIFVYEIDKAEPIPRPHVSPEAREAINRVAKHLIKIKSLVGEMVWSDEAKAFWDKWYIENRLANIPNPLMEGYFQTKHVQLLKVCMLLACAEPEPKLLLTPGLLEEGLALFLSIERNMPKLFIASGRSDLARAKQEILDYLDANNGQGEEGRLRTSLDSNVTPMEQISLLRHLVDTRQLIRRVEKNLVIYYLPEQAARIVSQTSLPALSPLPPSPKIVN